MTISDVGRPVIICRCNHHYFDRVGQLQHQQSTIRPANTKYNCSSRGEATFRPNSNQFFFLSRCNIISSTDP